MANHKKIVPFIKEAEGGLSSKTNDKASRYPCPTPYKGKTGYHTNKGVTYKTWVTFFGTNNDARFFAMSDNDWAVIFKKGFWDFIQGDKIASQAIADILVDWTWGSWNDSIIETQKILNKHFGFKLTTDGQLGPKTLAAINSVDSIKLFNLIHNAKLVFYQKIVNEEPSQIEWLNGWKNRANNLYNTVMQYVDLKKKVTY